MILMLFVKGAPRATLEKYIINMADDEVSWFAIPTFKLLVYILLLLQDGVLERGFLLMVVRVHKVIGF